MQNNEVEMKKNGKDKAVKCSSCEHVAKNRNALFYHKRTRHGTEEDKVKCHFCSYTHILKQGVFNHMKNNHNHSIKTLKAENKKLSTTNKDGSTSTLLKEIPFQKEENLEDEYSSDDNIPIQLLAKNSNSKIRMERTEEQSSDEEFIRKLLSIKKIKRYQCDKCGKILKNCDALYSHKQIHKTEEENLPCPQCERKFKRKFELKNHIQRTHEINHEAKTTYSYTRLMCQDCSFVTKTSGKLDLHIRTKHPNRKIPKRFMCEDCNFVTKRKRLLNLHIKRRHTSEKPFKCDICSKPFAKKCSLKVHSYSHAGFIFNCDICSKSFATNQYLIIHKRRHDMEGQACKDCGKVVREIHRHKRKCLANDNNKN